jgi:mono/diheme cytochrome c family protein
LAHRKISAALLATVAAGCIAGCRKAPTLTPQQAQGKHLYDIGCAHCHEENDLHLKKVPPSLHDVFSRSTLPDGEPPTEAEVERVLITGKGTMPSFAYQMTKEQMDAVVAYLHTGLRDQPSQDQQTH